MPKADDTLGEKDVCVNIADVCVNVSVCVCVSMYIYVCGCISRQKLGSWAEEHHSEGMVAFDSGSLRERQVVPTGKVGMVRKEPGERGRRQTMKTFVNGTKLKKQAVIESS